MILQIFPCVGCSNFGRFQVRFRYHVGNTLAICTEWLWWFLYPQFSIECRRRVQITSLTSFIQDEIWTLTDHVLLPDYCSVVPVALVMQCLNLTVHHTTLLEKNKLSCSWWSEITKFELSPKFESLNCSRNGSNIYKGWVERAIGSGTFCHFRFADVDEKVRQIWEIYCWLLQKSLFFPRGFF